MSLRGILSRCAVGVATVLAGTAVAVGGTGTPAYAATPRCNTAGFIPHLSGGYLDVPLYKWSTGSTMLCLMSYGDRGDDVQQLQWTLNYCYGERLSQDGIFGYYTKAAVIRTQKKVGVTADGIYGPQTAMEMVHPWVPNGGCR
jgi:hypothetical protein